MTAPATIMLAKIFIPETEKPATAGKVEIKVEKTAVNVIDAAAQGAGDGLHLALNIGGMLIAFLALIAMVNGILGWVHTLPYMGWLPASLEKIFGIVFAPVAWLMGVPWKDALDHRQPAGHAPGAQRIRGVPGPRADEGARSIRARSPSPPTRCAALRTSAPSPFRSAASARWRPTANRTWRGWACGPWRPEPWPTSCRPASRECCCDRKKPSVYIESRTALRPRHRRGAGQRPGRFRRRTERARRDLRTPRFPAGRASTAVGHAGKLILGKLGGLAVAVMAGRAHLYEGYTPAQVTFGVRVLRQLGVRVHGVHQRRRRHQPDARARRPGADLRPHQPAGLESAGGPERRFPGPALPRHVGRLLAAATAKSPSRWRPNSCIPLARRRLRRDARPQLRDARRDPLPAHHRRGRGGHVHGAGSDRGQPHGHEGAGHLLRHQHGGGHSAAEDQPRGSARNRRDGARHAGAVPEGAAAAAGGVDDRPARSTPRWPSREHAHAPFSKFKVGAALEDATAASTPAATWRTPPTASPSAPSAWPCSRPSPKARASSAASPSPPIPTTLTPPCGACRQILWEFCGDIEIVLVNLRGKTETYHLKDLFPKPFDASYL